MKPQDSVQPDLLADLDSASDEFGPDAVDRLLNWSIENDASDLHLLPIENGMVANVRIEGVLQHLCSLNASSERVVARLKVLSQLLTYKTDVPQEGRLPLERPGAESCDARVATCPTVHGEKAIVRFFHHRSHLQTLSEIGLSDDLSAEWLAALRQTQGLLLVTGPAGAGKTTTAYASIRALIEDSPSLRSIVSLEDPVEQLIDGVAQTPVAGTTGLSFADGLRAVLRHDPEVLLVGELRDRDTIETAVRAALTGHLVLATLHTGSAAEAVTRLLDAEIEPFLILSGLTAVLHQRLVRTRDGQRKPIAELLKLGDKAVREAIRSQCSSDEIEARALEAGMTPVRSTAQALHEAGELEQDEVSRLLLFG